MTRTGRRLWGTLALCLGFVWAGPAAAGGLTIGAGAGYKRPLLAVNALFESQRGIKVDQVFGNLGQVLAQAKAGAPLGVVFGDRAFLASAPEVHFTRFVEIGRGRLVLAMAKGLPAGGPEVLDLPRVEKIAIPDQDKAIYGKAGMEYLTRAGRLAALEPKLVMVATVPQASAYLVAGEVQAAFLNLTDALGIKDRVAGWVEIDPALYSPIAIVAGVVADRPSPPELAAYLEFLAGPEVAAIMRAHGL